MVITITYSNSTQRARPRSEPKDDLLLFTLQGDKYAVITFDVIQIVKNLSISPIVDCTPYMIGSTAIHGEILPVIDLQTFFYGKGSSLTEATADKEQIFITIGHHGEHAVFKVETVLGTIKRPKNALAPNLANFFDLGEVNYFDGAFIRNSELIVQLGYDKILEQITSDLDEFYNQFKAENKVRTIPVESLASREEYNIELQSNLSVPATTVEWKINRLVHSAHKDRFSGMVISVQNLAVMVPSDYIIEIYKVPNLTKIPNTSRSIVGAISYRGEILNVIDLSELLNIIRDNQKELGDEFLENQTALILEFEDRRIAIFVDEIQKIIEIDKTEIKGTIIPQSSSEGSYPFEGVFLDSLGQIYPVLNVGHLFTGYFNPKALEQKDNDIIFFENLVADSSQLIQESMHEGLVFEDAGIFFFIDSHFIVQAIRQETFLLKTHTHFAILGATIHRNIVPIIDFFYLLSGIRSKREKKEESVGIIVGASDSGFEAAFVVDNVIERLNVRKLDVFQVEKDFTSKTVSPIISGFFSYHGNLGLIINPSALIEETSILLTSNLGLEDIKNDFISTLLPEEIEYLEAFQARRKELELLLFSDKRSVKLDYFVFKWGEQAFAIDVNLVRGVFGSLHAQSVGLEYHPIIGVITTENGTQPILDLEALILNIDTKNSLNLNNDFFSLCCDERLFIIPVDSLEGVITTFKDEIQPCRDPSIFLGGEECCKYQFSYEKGQFSTNIIENDFLAKIIVQRGIDMLLGKLPLDKSK
ncbi:MAG: chemotaxis protein CheW [Candidatus Thorarchaeota archaeon]